MAKAKESAEPTETKEVRKLVKKEFSLSDFKAKKGLTSEEAKDKPLDFIPMSKAYTEATGMGLPIGYVSIVAGYSSVGKSTMLIEAIVGAQKKGVLPLIIDLENNFSFERAKVMGMEFEEILDKDGVITGYDGFFLYINNDYILKNHDKKRNKLLNEATIEGLGACVNNFLDEQENGSLDFPILIAIDSIGVLDSEKSILGNRNNMFNAAAYEANFKSILNYRIPSSRKEGKKHTNTLLAVNKIWLDSMNGAGVIKMKGGECFFYASRVITLLGGTLTHGAKKLVAQCTYKGVKYSYIFGTQVKIKLMKNHLSSLSFENQIVSVESGFISIDDVEDYKKENKEYLFSKMGITEKGISADIDTTYEDSDEIVNFGV